MKNRPPLPKHLGRHRYHTLLIRLQIELVKLQRSVVERGQRIPVIVGGRDAAGKDGTMDKMLERRTPPPRPGPWSGSATRNMRDPTLFAMCYGG
ncbi:hypothetical protein ACH79_25995 [Bradyrhizobium sp. CCBAU 051011]|uniref:hypothetical protein n=1 Tax=Bradyrhizobium sp. CCBAU 051011 TaxID=858422 RepID=UPI001373F649|nr:hypothetical protein [Bradyrhizobium sp. CCBAU 051011]QHO75574.1 hypothetical protein ACH79_25995 [Bradyrhizobium sp. CCBAU 051011]